MAQKIQFADRTLSGCGQNNVAIAVLTLGQDDHRRICDDLSELFSVVERMQSEHNKEQRGVELAEKYMYKKIADDGYMKDVCKVVDQLYDARSVRASGFEMRAPAIIKNVEAAMVVEEEFADRFGQARVGLAFELIRRNQWMFGFPHGMTRALNPKHEAATIKRFKAHVGHYTQLERDLAELGPKARIVHKRHTAPHTANKQYVEAYNGTKWKATADTQNISRKRNRPCQQTVTVKAIGGYMENAKRNDVSLAPIRTYQEK